MIVKLQLLIQICLFLVDVDNMECLIIVLESFVTKLKLGHVSHNHIKTIIAVIFALSSEIFT